MANPVSRVTGSSSHTRAPDRMNWITKLALAALALAACAPTAEAGPVAFGGCMSACLATILTTVAPVAPVCLKLCAAALVPFLP